MSAEGVIRSIDKSIALRTSVTSDQAMGQLDASHLEYDSLPHPYLSACALQGDRGVDVQFGKMRLCRWKHISASFPTSNRIPRARYQFI
jgi:hypothetical protein